VAHRLLGDVRNAYGHRCGYCGVREEDVGAELTVDHFRPTARGGGDALDNLVYCCFQCNVNKSDFYPNESQLAAGYRLLHPLKDDVKSHLSLDRRTGLLAGLTETGTFHIQFLDLNRPLLIVYRLGREVALARDLELSLLAEERDRLRAALEAERAALRMYLRNQND
jgi:hypothetical protein